MLPNMKFDGRLTRISGEADLQRNTLQVKVQILNPDKRLRPEMLCQAKFFSNLRLHPILKIKIGSGYLFLFS